MQRSRCETRKKQAYKLSWFQQYRAEVKVQRQNDCSLEAKLLLTPIPLFLWLKLQQKTQSISCWAFVYCHPNNRCWPFLCLNTDELNQDSSCQDTAQPDSCMSMLETAHYLQENAHSWEWKILELLGFLFVFTLGKFSFISSEMQSSVKSPGVLALASKDPNATI